MLNMKVYRQKRLLFLLLFSELDRHLDDMTATVINKKAILEALVSTNAELTKLSSKKLLKINTSSSASSPPDCTLL